MDDMSKRDKELKEEYRSTSGIRFGASEVHFTSIPLEKATLTPLPPKRITQYEEIITRATEIFLERNAIYKDAFEAVGLVGTISTLITDCHRLKNMVYETKGFGSEHTEEIKDKLLDVINQAVISIIVLDEGNFKGR